jgi:hypothetical protein
MLPVMVSSCLEAENVNLQWRTRPDLYIHSVTIGSFAATSATKSIVSRVAGPSAIRTGGTRACPDYCPMGLQTT